MDNIQKRVMRLIVSCENHDQLTVAINYLENYINRHPGNDLFFVGCHHLLLEKLVKLSCEL